MMMSFNENDMRVSKNCTHNASTKEETQIPKGCHFFPHPVHHIGYHVSNLQTEDLKGSIWRKRRKNSNAHTI